MDEATVSRSLISALLSESTPGGRSTFDEVFPLVYEELRRMARHQLAGQWGKCTLNTTGLVHEAYLKLVNESQVPARGRAYFFGAAASAMRRILVDAARRRNSVKRGGGGVDVTLDEALTAADGFAVDVMALDEALTRFAEHYPRQANVVECRFFGGLSIEETATTLDMSRRSVIRDWAMARAWLYRELEVQTSGG